MKMNMKPKGIVNVVGAPIEGKALILGLESPGKWWLYMIAAQWHCIVSRAYITSVNTTAGTTTGRKGINEMKMNEYQALMYGEHNETSACGLDLAAIAEAVVACYAARVYPSTMGEPMEIGTRENQLISSAVCVSLLTRNNGDFGAAAIALPGAIARAFRLLDQAAIEVECTTDGETKINELFRTL